MVNLRNRVDRLERGADDGSRQFLWADSLEELAHAPAGAVVAHYEGPGFEAVRRNDVLEVVLPEKVADEDAIDLEDDVVLFLETCQLMRDKTADPEDRVKAAHRLSSTGHDMRHWITVELPKPNLTWEEILEELK